MNKKMIIITIVLGVISFVGTFSLGLLNKKQPEGDTEQTPQTSSTQTGMENIQPEQPINTIPAVERTAVTISMSEQQLKNLIHDLRIKMQDYENRLQALNEREQRLEIVQDVLKQDIKKLTDLQTELASITAGIRSEQEKLLRSKLEIDQIEKSNLVLIAATYDKMDASSASKILANMCTVEDSNKEQTPRGDGSGTAYDDAVRILYYMTERKKAQLLAVMAASEPQLASILSQRLKQITEVN